MPDLLSIVIVNYRGWKRLDRCLASFDSIPLEALSLNVTVVDNASNDGQLDDFMIRFPKINFVENTGNTGFAHGCNFGAMQSNSEYLLFLNPDTEIEEKTINTLIETAESHPEYKIFSCQQPDENGRDTKPFGMFPSNYSLTGLHRSLFRSVVKSKYKSFEINLSLLQPEWVSGSVVFMSRSFYEKLGGWSEDYWLYYEDVDLCYRTSQMGGKIAYLKSTQITHTHGGASRINPRTKALTKSEVAISSHVYVAKHFRGMSRWIALSYLIITNGILRIVPAAIGLLLFWIPSAWVHTRIYAHLIAYYFNAAKQRTWISPRAPNYLK